MAVQQTRRVLAADWAHYCPACEGPMKLVMASPSERPSGARVYSCEYVCDCGLRQIFDEPL
ncbi:MAG: hypothetical protein ABSA68_13445 [Xanthobacteraceae bacterium]|jgi:C4-type Zn-finger protein